MKKQETLKRYHIDKIDDSTVFISGKFFLFSYTVAGHIVKEEYKDKYRYFGGLQCDFNEGSNEYINLEKWLCEIAEMILNTK